MKKFSKFLGVAIIGFAVHACGNPNTNNEGMDNDDLDNMNNMQMDTNTVDTGILDTADSVELETESL